MRDLSPGKLTELQRFFNDGEWEENGNDAVARLKGLQARKVFMKKLPPDRWVLLDREKDKLAFEFIPAAEAKPRPPREKKPGGKGDQGKGDQGKGDKKASEDIEK